MVSECGLTEEGLDEWLEGRRQTETAGLLTTKQHWTTAHDLVGKPARHLEHKLLPSTTYKHATAIHYR